MSPIRNKDLVYIIIIFIIVISNLLAIILWDGDAFEFIGGVSSAISIILSVVAIIYTLVSGIGMAKIDTKIDELSRTIHLYNEQKNEVRQIVNSIMPRINEIQHSDVLKNNLHELSELENLRKTLESVSKQFIDD
jgi:hypothetical protein